jgi:hypothetical protein
VVDPAGTEADWSRNTWRGIALIVPLYVFLLIVFSLFS